MNLDEVFENVYILEHFDSISSSEDILDSLISSEDILDSLISSEDIFDTNDNSSDNICEVFRIVKNYPFLKMIYLKQKIYYKL